MLIHKIHVYTHVVFFLIYIVSRNEERWRAEYKKIITEGEQCLQVRTVGVVVITESVSSEDRVLQ